MASDRTSDFFVRYLRQAQPLRRLSVLERYGITLGIVLVCFPARYALGDIYPYPYPVFLPGIILASFVFDRGSGFFATFVSAGLALYFFVEPAASFRFRDIGTALSLGIFLSVGLVTAAIIEALRTAVEELSENQRRLEDSLSKLGDSLNLLETVIEGTPDPIYVKDAGGRFVRVNTPMARMLGAPAAAILGKRDRDFLPLDQAEKIESADRVVMETRAPLLLEEQMTVAGQGPRWFLTTKAPWYGPDGRLSGVIGLARDIEERKRAEDEIRAANIQKELLLYDINHRVKNHLQSVVAALSLSRNRIPDGAARVAVENTIARLSVLSRVYDRLELRPGGEAVVNARDFVEGLCQDLAPALLGLRPIALRTVVADETIDLARAVSVGLLVNEALTNALKYAFPDDRAGTVTVSLLRDDETLVLQVADDGVGTQRERIFAGTGTKLIRALAQQLGGKAAFENAQGTVLTVRFPASPPR